jgi:hypothetical protein
MTSMPARTKKGQRTGRSADEPRRTRIPVQSRIPSPDEPHRTTCAVHETEGHRFESCRARLRNPRLGNNAGGPGERSSYRVWAEMRRSRRGLLAVTATSIALLGSALLAGGASAAPTCEKSAETVTCTYTSGSNRFRVPKGVSSIHVVAVGGSGAAGGGAFGAEAGGGSGGRVEGNLSVAARATLYAVVGGNASGPTPGANGGGQPGVSAFQLIPGFCVSDPIATCGVGAAGGGASDVRTSQGDLATRLLVAAGGGGGGGHSLHISFAGGGTTITQPGGAGGAGGGGDGASSDGTGGGGGGTDAGGAGGAGAPGCTECSPGADGGSGAIGVGGHGGNGGLSANDFNQSAELGGGGGGGGGGLFGGGGGGGGTVGGGGGGGGGSNLVPPDGSTSVDTTGIPLVQISYPRRR